MAEQMGEYNRRIEIWQHTGTKDAAGEFIPGDWVLYKPKWAKIRGRNGISYIREIGAQNGKTADAALDLLSFRVPFCTDITVDMQVRWKGTQYDIILTRPDNADREFTDIVVRSGASSG